MNRELPRGMVGAGGWLPQIAICGLMLAEHYQRPGWFTPNVFNRIAPDNPMFRVSDR